MADDRIKVMQIFQTFDISGAEKFAIELARALPPDQFDLSLCGFFETGSDLEKTWLATLAGEGIRAFTCIRWQGDGRYRIFLSGLKTLRNHLQSAPVHIIHSHFQLGTWAGLEMRSLGLARRVVRTAHNHMKNEWAYGRLAGLKRWLLGGWIYPLALDAETAVSQAILEELRKNPGKVLSRREPVLTYNSISQETIRRASLLPRPSREAGVFHIGSVGRLTPQKGYQVLLEAMPALAARLPNLCLTIIGEGEMRADLEARAGELGVSASVEFPGRRPDVLEQMLGWDLFVCSSLWEGLPTVILESMACGTPVLATNIAGVTDIIRDGENGWLVQPGNPEALAGKIVEILLNRQATEQVAQEASKRLDPFTFTTVAKTMSQVYKQLMIDRRPS
jgi:glycosyltransferase involved in cell wall biosynthesis